MKNHEQLRAKELRSQGMSVKKIAKELGVSSGSVSIWVRDIVLTPDQIDTLKSQSAIYDTQHRGAKARQEKARQQRLQYQEEGRIKAREKNPLHMAGCMLYWAEGTKNRTHCEFANSDLNMLKMFLAFLYNAYHISKNDLTIYVHCYTTNGIAVEQIEEFWQKELDLPQSIFNKSTVNNISKYSFQKKATNKLLYGTVHIRVNKSTWLVQNIFGAIQEYGNFNNNFCLD